MEPKIVIGVDCGTQSLRAALYRTDGVLLAEAGYPYETRRPRINWAEQNPEDWWTALCRAVPECLAKAGVAPGDVAAIACDGTSFTGVFCREDGTPLRPALLWMDIRAAEEAREIEATQDPVLEYCGRRISAEWMMPKALWVRRNEPEVFGEAGRLIEGVDWLIYRLTGRWVTSTSNASGKRHWTLEHGWPKAFYERLGMPELLGMSPDDVVYVGDSIATLTPDAAAALGLTPNCIVAHGGMDGWIAPVGMNSLGKGSAALTLGTSTVVVAETSTPILIDGIMGPFPEGIRRGYSVYEAGQTSGGSVVGWFADLCGVRLGSEEHRALEAEAASLPPGSDGLIVFDAFQGNRTPYFDPLARANICGLTLHHGRAALYRAILEGSAYGIRSVFDVLDCGGHPIQEVRVTGSGAANRLWCEIIATVTGRPLLVSTVTQATALGSAVCAATAAGAHPGLEAAAEAMAPPFETVWPGGGLEVYDTCYRAYVETYRLMRGTMHCLSNLSGMEKG
ncbi:MAG: FGGY-family carbohydrate kinase [FCB group bacterium]|jgi:ribulokinase|nr:FGGY-family carbohydrate kinase [FCB group bacterium]